MQISAIAEELNLRSKDRIIGTLQDIRKSLKGHKRRVPGQLFSAQTIAERFAFHTGGRTELQFNIGIEKTPDGAVFRHGLAFSMERSRTLITIEGLLPKVERFNEYLRVYPDEFSDLRMRHYRKGVRSDDYSPSVIPPERCAFGNFIFLGQTGPVSSIDYDGVLDSFERLLPLYEFVESSGALFPTVAKNSIGLQFKPGCPQKPSATVATPAQLQIDVKLRHNDMQIALHRILAERFGKANVGTEIATGTGTRIDLVVRPDELDYWYYEIKTDLSARACIRAGIAQLLEYSLWPSGTQAKRLFIVGEPKIDQDTRDFLGRLRQILNLPLFYVQLDRARVTLSDPA